MKRVSACQNSENTARENRQQLRFGFCSITTTFWYGIPDDQSRNSYEPPSAAFSPEAKTAHEVSVASERHFSRSEKYAERRGACFVRKRQAFGRAETLMVL